MKLRSTHLGRSGPESATQATTAKMRQINVQESMVAMKVWLFERLKTCQVSLYDVIDSLSDSYQIDKHPCAARLLIAACNWLRWHCILPDFWCYWRESGAQFKLKLSKLTQEI